MIASENFTLPAVMEAMGKCIEQLSMLERVYNIKEDIMVGWLKIARITGWRQT